MSEILRLEYACTDAEKKEAESLVLRKQLGGGSKWRTWLVLLVVLVGLLLRLFDMVRREVAPAYRPFFLAAFFGFVGLFVLWRRRSRRMAPVTTQVEVSEEEFTILGPESRVSLPWSAFSECLESPGLFVLLDRPKTTSVVIPKRAFPSEDWQAWFRERTNNLSSSAEQPPVDVPEVATTAPGDRVEFTVQLGFRDHLDRTLASWRTWGFCLTVAGIIIGIGLYSAANPPPDAVVSATEVFFMFMLPFLFVMMLIVILVGSLQGWLSQAKYSAPQEVALSEQSIVFSGRDASGTLPWTAYTHYKETPWSFILWKARGPVWTMFPKRAFASDDDMHRCRELLDRHLRYSRWFLG